MNAMHINSLDLNLITALHALLQERSVSSAAERVGRTQSAMSHALGRLRHQFNDPLLVREGWSMRLTPFAQSLVDPVGRAVSAIEDVFEAGAQFNPALDQRRIVIATPDLCAPLFSGFVGKLQAMAPNMSVEFTTMEDVRDAVSRSLADVGLGFTSGKSDVSLEVSALPPLEWAVFAPKNHNYAVSGLAQDWANARHIGVRSPRSTLGPIDRAAKVAGLKRSFAAQAQNFTAALVMASQEDALFTTLKAPFEPLAAQIGMVACPVPFEMLPAQATLTTPADFGNPFRIWVRSVLNQTLTLN